jgi:predicted metal-binding membrane protein
VTTSALEQSRPLRSDGWLVTAVRVRLALVGLLVGIAALAWWWTARRMSGMDGGPWTSLGGLGWFVSLWVVMMAAMMFPSIAPTVALYSRMTSKRSPLTPLAFVGGYLLTWACVGLAAYGFAVAGGTVASGVLAWDRAGRWVAAATLVAAAIYELTPLKDVCLGKCRSPLGALLSSWRGGMLGALSMGVRNGAWCVGCCWALMVSLFALGIMSVVWMAFVSALIAAEKLIPWKRVATYGTAAILLALGILLVAAPHALPGLTIPSGTMGMTAGG